LHGLDLKSFLSIRKTKVSEFFLNQLNSFLIKKISVFLKDLPVEGTEDMPDIIRNFEIN